MAGGFEDVLVVGELFVRNCGSNLLLANRNLDKKSHIPKGGIKLIS